MVKAALFITPLIMIASAGAAEALPLLPPVTVGVTGGTLGVGPEVSYAINPLIAVRGSATFLGVSGHGNVGDYHYKGHLHLENYGGTIDIHPFLNGFRISAGARSTGSDHARVMGMPRTPQTYGGMTFSPADAGTLTGTLHTKSVSPLVTVGYAHSGLSGFTFGIDGGVMFHGRPTVDDFVATGELGTNPLAQADLIRQEQRLNDKIKDYRYYPVLQLSLGYRF